MKWEKSYDQAEIKLLFGNGPLRASTQRCERKRCPATLRQHRRSRLLGRETGEIDEAVDALTSCQFSSSALLLPLWWLMVK